MKSPAASPMRLVMSSTAFCAETTEKTARATGRIEKRMLMEMWGFGGCVGWLMWVSESVEEEESSEYREWRRCLFG